MSLTIGIIILVSVLIILGISLNVVQQNKRKVESEKRNEAVRLKLVVDDTEQLLSAIGTIPVTKSLMVIFHTRIYESLKTISELTGDTNIRSHISDRKVLLESIKSNFQTVPLERFRLPDDDRQVLQFVQLLKKIKSVLRAEHNRGRVSPDVFASEIKRADLLQIRINIDSVIKRARIAIQAKQMGSAKTYLEKAIATLSKINREGDEFVSNKLAEATELMGVVDQNRQDRIDKDAEERKSKEANDLDMLFQPKKKW